MWRCGVVCGVIGCGVVLVVAGGCDSSTDVRQALSGSVDMAKQTKARAEMRQLAEMLMADEMAGMGWPSDDEGFGAMAAGGSIRPSNLLDSWENEYVYHAPSGTSDKPTILSVGPDGEEGTSDDIVYEWPG